MLSIDKERARNSTKLYNAPSTRVLDTFEEEEELVWYDAERGRKTRRYGNRELSRSGKRDVSQPGEHRLEERRCHLCQGSESLRPHVCEYYANVISPDMSNHVDWVNLTPSFYQG